MEVGANIWQKRWKRETDGRSEGRAKREMARTALKAVTKDKREGEENEDKMKEGKGVGKKQETDQRERVAKEGIYPKRKERGQKRR